jgi:hypothetical protein
LGTSALKYLHCNNNKLTSLNLSANTALISLYCLHNQLTSLNVKNGNNTNFVGFESALNTNLTCIQVDTEPWSPAHWSKDANSFYSSDCTTGISESLAKENISIYPSPNNGVFTISSSKFQHANLEIYNVIGEKIYSVKLHSDKQIIDLSEQENGFYFIQINTEKENRIQKISINK